MLGMEARTFKLWWTGYRDGVGGLGVMVRDTDVSRCRKSECESDGSCVGF